MLSFTIKETMTGVHRFIYNPEREFPLEFIIDWSPWFSTRPKLKKILCFAAGNIYVGGLGKPDQPIPCMGTLELRYLHDRRLVYTLNFHYDGNNYKLIGEKTNIRPWNLLTSHTTCFVQIINADTKALISTGVVRFRLRTLPRFLASLRLHRA